MAKKTAKEVVSEVTQKINESAKETKAENGEELSKEGKEAATATKNFFKEVGEWFVVLFKYIGKFFKKLLTKK